MQRKALIGTIFLLVALILIGSSLFLPWYRMEFKMTMMGQTDEGYADYYLDHAKMEMMGMEEEIQYDEDEATEDLNYIQVYRTTQIFVVIGFIGCAIGLVGTALVMSNKVKREIGIVLVLITLILSIIAPIYFMFALPSAYQEDMQDNELSDTPQYAEEMGESFFGSSEEDYGEMGFSMTMEVSWGGSTGWFLAVIAVILSFFSLWLVIISKSFPGPYYHPQYGPYPYYDQLQYPQQPPIIPPQQPPPPPPPPNSQALQLHVADSLGDLYYQSSTK